MEPPKNPRGCTILIADQHSVTRAGVRATLAKEKCQFIETGNGYDAVKLCAKHRPAVAVLGIHLPLMNGVCTAHRILTSNTGTRVLILSDRDDDDTIERAMAVNVHGYLCKSSDIAQLPAAVRALRQGLTWFDATVQASLARHAGMPGYPRKINLSPREQEVAQLIVEQFNNKQAGEHAGLSRKTVDHHRQNIMRKLKQNDVIGVVRWAVREGFITP